MSIQDFLKQIPRQLLQAVQHETQKHLDGFNGKPAGYALIVPDPQTELPQHWSLSAVCAAKLPRSLSEKYCPEEWDTDQNCRVEERPFPLSTEQIQRYHSEFRLIHPAKDLGRFDSIEKDFHSKLLAAILQGLELARPAFSGKTYLLLWSSNFECPIIAESIRRLNSASVADSACRQLGYL